MIISTFVYSMSPFQILRKNYIENFNELMLFLCALFQMVLAGYTFDNSTGKASSTRLSVSNFIIASISFLIAVNTFEAVSDLVH